MCNYRNPKTLMENFRNQSSIDYSKSHIRQEENPKKSKYQQNFSKVKVTLNVFDPIGFVPDDYYGDLIMYRLTRSERKVLDNIAFLQLHCEYIEPSQIGWLVKQTGLSRGYINRILRKLHALGLVHRVNNGYKRRCTYYLNAIFLDLDFREKFVCFLPALRFSGKAFVQAIVTSSLSFEESTSCLSLLNRESYIRHLLAQRKIKTYTQKRSKKDKSSKDEEYCKVEPFIKKPGKFVPRAEFIRNLKAKSKGKKCYEYDFRPRASNFSSDERYNPGPPIISWEEQKLNEAIFDAIRESQRAEKLNSFDFDNWFNVAQDILNKFDG